MQIAAVRTPEEAFANLPDWPWPPRFREGLSGYDGLQMHYIDEGPKNAEHTFLCLHGEPTWGYLYRRMIPPFLSSGARVVVPDLFGFGRSDKPIDDAVYTWDFHRNALIRFVEHVDLQNITLVVQDWGGLLGLTLPIAFPQRIARLIVMNTAFGVGESASPGFIQWRDYVARTPDLPVGALIKRGTPHLTQAEVAAYDAPFPDKTYKAGVRRFPALVPITPDMDGVAVSKAARAWWSMEFTGKSFMAIGMKDPVLGAPVMQALHAHIRGCPPPLEIADGGHFVQEWGKEIAEAALRSFG
jgi:haloalkane dehalogenase